MCGIVGYKGNNNASQILLKGIKNLEYRGYDSIGIATIDNKKINLKKDIGKIEEVQNKVNFLDLSGNIGIAHTRWATTGAVTKENSHPHFSMDETICVVHNGIIENYQQLRDFLINNNFKFKSKTDTEVIPHLIQFYKSKKLDDMQAFRKTLQKLSGSFAIAAIIKENDKILFARRGSPLVLGLSANETFLASDVPAFLEHTNKVIYLDNNEYGIIGAKPEIFDIDSNLKICKDIKTVKWSVEETKKGDYDHFMLKEINEQKDTIRRSIEQSPELVEMVRATLQSAYGVFFVGCGTSYHAAVSASYIFSHIAKKHVNVVLGSEFRNYKEFLTDKTVMIAISQSGETADLLDAVEIAKKKGVKIISIVNVMGSTLTRLSDINIMMNSGPEICVCSTKSYTSQLSILLYLAYLIDHKEEFAKELIIKCSLEVESIINNQLENIKKIAEKIKDKKDIFLIGRDLAYPSALEGALKIKEVSYIHAEGFAGGELKHGTIALIEKGTPCIVLSTDATKDMILSNANEIKTRGGHIIGIGSENNEVYEDFIKVSELGNSNPIAMIVPIQILAYYLATKKGCDPDKPRNLAKCVTVK